MSEDKITYVVKKEFAYHTIRDWHDRVYATGEPRHEVPPEVRMRVRKRDGHRCQMCGKRKDLELHHIMPRDEGGADSAANLILFCRKCHDIAEEEQLRTSHLIRNWQPPDDDEEEDDISLYDMEETERADWHTWVYGGKRNPRK